MVNAVNDAPSEFQAANPANGAATDTPNPVLQVTNASDPDGDALTYTFEVYRDESLSTLVDSVSDLSEAAAGTTSWTVATVLENHQRYVWRAVATDEHGAASATWLNEFVVSTGNHAPEAPGIVAPPDGSEIAADAVDLVLSNARDGDSDPLAYSFEVDTDHTFAGPDLMASGPVVEGASVTRWGLTGLSDNTEYFWRSRADDGTAQSPWVQGAFFVNRANECPSTPTVRNPGDGSWVQTLTPRLQLNPVQDVDRDRIACTFELFRDASPLELLARERVQASEWTVPFDLDDNGLYRWRARAEDEHGAQSPWTGFSTFFVNNNGVDDPPEMVFTAPAADLALQSGQVEIRWVDDDPDSNASISIACSSNSPNSAGADEAAIAGDLKEDPDGDGDAVLWDVSNVSEGAYRITGTIADGSTSRSFQAPGRVTVDRTPPVVEAQPSGGSYPSSQTITLPANEAASIHYTLDGVEPGADSPRYTSPIEIMDSATLRFAAVDGAGNRSPVRSESYTIQPAGEVHRFAIRVPSRIQSGLGFPLTVRAVGPSGGPVKDFEGQVSLEVSAGILTPTMIQGFKRGVWKGEARLSGVTGEVTITAGWNGKTGSSRPVTLRCDPPKPPVLSRPRDGALLAGESGTFSWHGARGATSYTIELARDVGFNEIVFQEEAIAGRTFSPPPSVFAGVGEGATVHWRVRAVNGRGSSEPSRPRRFILGGASMLLN